MDFRTIHSPAAAVSRGAGRVVRDSRRCAAGFTLVEVLLSLTLLAVVALSIVLLMQSVSRGTRTSEDVRRVNLRQEVVAERVDPRIRAASKVLAATPGALVLWLGDERANNAIDLSELCRLEYDAASKELRCYAAPADLPEAQDQRYADTEDFDAITTPLVGTADFPGVVVQRNLTAWTFATDNATPAKARAVRYVFSLESDGTTLSGARSTALRGQ